MDNTLAAVAMWRNLSGVWPAVQTINDNGDAARLVEDALQLSKDEGQMFRESALLLRDRVGKDNLESYLATLRVHA